MNTTLIIIALILIAGLLAIKTILDIFSKKDLNEKYKAALRKITEDLTPSLSKAEAERDHYKNKEEQAQSKILELTMQLQQIQWQQPQPYAQPQYQQPQYQQQQPYPQQPIKRGRPAKADYEEQLRSQAQSNADIQASVNPTMRQGMSQASMQPPLPETNVEGLFELKVSKMTCPSCLNQYFKPASMVTMKGGIATQEWECGICHMKIVMSDRAA